MIPSILNRLMSGRGIGWRVARIAAVVGPLLFAASLILFSVY